MRADWTDFVDLRGYLKTVCLSLRAKRSNFEPYGIASSLTLLAMTLALLNNLDLKGLTKFILQRRMACHKIKDAAKMSNFLVGY